MQFLEILFAFVTVLFLMKLLFNAQQPLLKSSHFVFAGYILLILGVIFEGGRWQMIPLYVSFVILALSSYKKTDTWLITKVLVTLVVIFMTSLSLLLASQFPVVQLPAPNGEHAVGTFSYSMVDESRIERYAPDKKRELFVQVWYPADKALAKDVSVRTLWQEMYSGKLDMFSVFSSHLAYTDTHSHIQSPIVAGDNFPVLIFNHGLYLVAEQNTVLMEHLASHGYVIFSIAHPYLSAKVNVSKADTITASTALPAAATLNEQQKMRGSELFNNITDNGTVADLILVHELARQFSAASDSHKSKVLENAMLSGEITAIIPNVSAESFADLLSTIEFNNRTMQSWVADIAFIADTIVNIKSPVEGFYPSLSTKGFGVFGMSRGGAAATQFCKIDARCLAGFNMDGFNYGSHWNTPLKVPFTMLYSVGNTGMNDFSFTHQSRNVNQYTFDGVMHADFSDLVFIAPFIHYLEMGQGVDALRTNDIINLLHLRFFNQHVKKVDVEGNIAKDIPDLRAGKQHEI